jgi:hypothetical protein
MTPVQFALTPRLVFDLRDWYRTTFSAIQIPDSTSANGHACGIVRAIGDATLIVSPPDPPDPNWPFGEAMELVIQESANGIRAFHGRMRSASGVLTNRSSRQFVKRAKCRLSIHVRGFQPYVMSSLEIPGINDAGTMLPPIDLFPAVNYSFPSAPRKPCLVEGAVRTVTGAGLAGATISPVDPRPQPVEIPLPAVTTTADGRYLLILDPLVDDDGLTPFSEIDIEISHPQWAASAIHSVKFGPGPDPLSGTFHPPHRATLPTTVVLGRVLRAGRPVADAIVSLHADDQPLLIGRVRTNWNGDWIYHGDARLPIEGEQGVTVRVATPGQTIDANVFVRFGKRNVSAPVLIPES